MKCVGDRACVDNVYIDLRRAFDSISRLKLVHKLRAYGINTKVCDWFGQFLLNRLQRVFVNVSMSELLQGTSGVPQGSILRPILFLICIHDLPPCVLVLHFQIFLYADDAKFFKRINCRLDCFPF